MPSMMDNADLWSFNPATGRLYTTAERRDMLSKRGVPMSMLGGGQQVAGRDWDRWGDEVAESNLELTGKTPAQLTTRFAGGESPDDSDQLRGFSAQPGPSSWMAKHALRGALDAPGTQFEDNAQFSNPAVGEALRNEALKRRKKGLL